jgi:hypothetical protein
MARKKGRKTPQPPQRGTYQKRDPDEVVAKQAEIVSLMIEGNSFSRSCRKADVKHQTGWDWMKAFPEFSEAVQEARARSAETFRDIIHDAVIEGVKTVTTKKGTRDETGYYEEESITTNGNDRVRYAQWMIVRLAPEQWADRYLQQQIGKKLFFELLDHLLKYASDTFKSELAEHLAFVGGEASEYAANLATTPAEGEPDGIEPSL